MGREVAERKITLSEWRDGVASGEIAEVFACGTAAVITPIGVLKDTTEFIGRRTRRRGRQPWPSASNSSASRPEPCRTGTAGRPGSPEPPKPPHTTRGHLTPDIPSGWTLVTPRCCLRRLSGRCLRAAFLSALRETGFRALRAASSARAWLRRASMMSFHSVVAKTRLAGVHVVGVAGKDGRRGAARWQVAPCYLRHGVGNGPGPGQCEGQVFLNKDIRISCCSGALHE